MDSINNLFAMLSNNEKKKAILILIIVLITAFLDVIGVASILPFITVLSNPELISTNFYLKSLYDLSKSFGVQTTEQFLFFLGIGVFILLIISLIFRSLNTYALAKFALGCEYSWGRRLIESYLNQPYVWFLNRHSSDLGRSILSEVNTVVNSYLIPFLALISQIIVTLGLLILLIFIDPYLAFSVITVLSICYILVFFIMKNFLTKLGTGRLKANTKRFTSISEAFNAVKEIKVSGKEEVYMDRFSKPALTFANHQSVAVVIGQLPRFFLEGLAFGGMILLVLVLINRGSNFFSIVPVIALYAFAGYRLMPALQQIYLSFTQIRFSKPALDTLYKDIINLKPTVKIKQKKNLISLKKSLELEKICFSYPNSKEMVLNNISLNIPTLSKIGIVGSTGSGKTTIVDIILGLINPSKGKLTVDKTEINSSNANAWQKGIGYVPQNIYLSDESIAANIAFGEEVNNINHQAVIEASKAAYLHNFVIEKLPNQYETKVGERGVRLSGGQRQRVGIARALYHKPQVLILDEATSALDNHTEQVIMNEINKLESNITIIMIAHRLQTVKNCDKIFFLEKGKLKAEGTYDELFKSYESFRKISGIK